MPGPRHQPFPIPVRDLEVLEAFDVTPTMRRIVLGGEQLEAFTAGGWPVEAFRTENADDHVKLIVPDPTGQTGVPTQNDGYLDWTREQLRRARDYTPRRFDAAAGRLEVDFVRHRGGLAAGWAESVTPGARVSVAGPRGTTVLPDDIDWWFMVADETALPAVCRRLEELPAGTPVTAVVLVDGPASEQSVEHRCDLELIWLHRRRDEARVNERVLEAVKGATWREGPVYAWAAGEALMLTPLRRWLRDERLVPASHLDVTGYWREGADQAQRAEGVADLRARCDLSFPYALRVAVSLDVAEHLLDGATTAEELASRTGARGWGLEKILARLQAEGYLDAAERDGVRRWSLSTKGSLLTEERVREAFDRRSGQARLDDAWPGLLHTVRTGGPGYEHVTGRTFWESMAADEHLGESFDDGLADWSDLWSGALAEVIDDDPAWAGHVIDVGGGAGAVLSGLLGARPNATGTLVELPTTAARAEAAFGSAGVLDRVQVVRQSFFEPLPSGGDVYLLSQVLHDWPDAEATAILARIAEAVGVGRVVVVERIHPSDDPPHDHDVAFDLQMHAVFGGGERTGEQYATLAQAAGLRHLATSAVDEEMAALQFVRA